MELVIATGNKNKVIEIKKVLGNSFKLLSLADIGCHEELPETSSTLKGNALQKARYIHKKFGYDCFADDTGLEIESLNGAPGVYSARYAGESKKAKDNIKKVLSELDGETNRKALFKTVIALIVNGSENCFEGKVAGEITKLESGAEGFGYDPIFRPNGYLTTFSEMSLEEKNKISHRGKAISLLREYLYGLKMKE